MDIINEDEIFLKISYDNQMLVMEAIHGDSIKELIPKDSGNLSVLELEKVTVRYTKAIYDKVTHPKYNSYLIVNRPELTKEDLTDVMYIELDPRYNSEYLDGTSNPTFELFHNLGKGLGSVLVRDKIKYFVPYNAKKEYLVLNTTNMTLYIKQL